MKRYSPHSPHATSGGPSLEWDSLGLDAELFFSQEMGALAPLFMGFSHIRPVTVPMQWDANIDAWYVEWDDLAPTRGTPIVGVTLFIPQQNGFAVAGQKFRLDFYSARFLQPSEPVMSQQWRANKSDEAVTISSLICSSQLGEVYPSPIFVGVGGSDVADRVVLSGVSDQQFGTDLESVPHIRLFSPSSADVMAVFGAGFVQ